MIKKTNKDKQEKTTVEKLKNIDVSVTTAKKIAKVASIFVGLFIIYQVICIFFFPSPSAVKERVDENGELIIQEQPIRTLNPDHKEAYLVKLSEDESIVVGVAAFRDDLAKEGKENLYVLLYDPETGKEVKRTRLKIDLSMKGKGMDIDSPIALYTDAKENLFLIVNKYSLYRFDKKRKQFAVVDYNYFEGYSEFSTGISALDYSAHSEALKVHTNGEKDYLFYPDIKKVYSSIEADSVYVLALTNPILKTGYTFSQQSIDYPNEKIQLFEYVQEFEAGYPNKRIAFRWVDKSTKSDTGQTQYGKEVISAANKQAARIKSFRDLTPGKGYLEGGAVLGFDEEGVVVALKLTEVEDQPYAIQKLNTKTGKVIWSKNTDWKVINTFNQVSNRILIQSDLYHVVILDMQGEFVTTIDLNDIQLEVIDSKI